MATAIKRPPSPSSLPRTGSDIDISTHPILKLFDATYRFFASLKLAVFSIATLALVLAYATFFESWYGTHAVQEWIYRSKAFALLLAFLGINIFCAALIRFRWDEGQKGWTRRQTGFVITHVGLLIVLVGSWITLRSSDEGQVMLLEGETATQMVRPEHSVVRVQKVDAHSGRPSNDQEFELPFRPGSFAWESAENANTYASRMHLSGVPLVGNIKATIAAIALLAAVGFFLMSRRSMANSGARKTWRTLMQVSVGIAAIFVGFYFGYPTGVVRQEVLTSPNDPFRVVVKDYLPASSLPIWVNVADKAGPRKIKVGFEIQPPGFPNPMDFFDLPGRSGRDRWLEIDNPRLDVTSLQAGPALIRFSHVDTTEKLDDFLNPPKHPLTDRQARFHYVDRAGKPRVFEWLIDDKAVGKPFLLPDSDFSVTFSGVEDIPFPSKSGVDDGEVLHTVKFEVRKGDGPEVSHMACAGLPMIPNVIPTSRQAKPPAPLVRVSYYHPPGVSPQAMGPRTGVIEVMATDSGRLYYRAFNRHGMHGPAPLELGKNIDVFGAQSPMKARFRVDEYAESGDLDVVYEGLEMPKGQADNGFPACLVELQVGGDRKQVWLRRDREIDDLRYQDVVVGSDHYKVAYDYDRKPLGFDLTLTDFDMGTDPGTKEASSYTSKIVVNDAEKGVKDKAVTITMNEPMWYRGQTFYQSQFREPTDSRTGRKTGEKKSVFQVGIDPYWGIKYLGCLTVVLGTFVQFYMRAGVFTDGGKKEREQAAAKARRRLLAKQGLPPEPDDAGRANEVVSDFEEL